MLESMLNKFGYYSPVGDIITVIICLLMIILLGQTFVTRDLNYRVFLGMLVLVACAGLLNLSYHAIFATSDTIPVIFIYAIRLLTYICLFLVPFLYVYYLYNLLGINSGPLKKLYMGIAGTIFALLFIVDIAGSALGFGFVINPDRSFTTGFNFFAVAYMLYVFLNVFILIRHRNNIVVQILQGIMISFILCTIVQIIQGRHGQTSFLVCIFLIPVITIMYLLHSNPYDIETGAINEASFNKMIIDSYYKQRNLMLVCLHVHDFEKHTNMLRGMHLQVYSFYRKVVKKGNLFKLSGDRLVLVYRIDQNPDYEDTNRQLIRAFAPLYEKFNLNFKVIFIKSIPELSLNNSYPDLMDFVEPKCNTNDYYTVSEDDILNFSRRLYIISQLEDIANKMDLDDPRVLVFCQPVYNVATGEYDTAEALMRMELPETGFLFPDMFIPVAEQTDLIHPLSLIILNKTCKVIHRMLDDGFKVNRISINFSIQEVRDDSFCKDILRIIEMNDIPYGKVAIELTESRNTTDFNMVKEKINQLKEKGITFYLDDFGTGYSNFDRIMELPFDIIKFDRSLVIESGKDKTSEYMVHTFADMFHKLNYKVLYEGVEDTTDEARCIRMYAQYLQGYKYSKPIPIVQLENFFSRTFTM